MHPKLTLHASMLPHCHECMMSFIPMHTTWNYSDTGRDMYADMSFIFLSVCFRDTSRLLHITTIHIASWRVSLSFYAYITNICRLYKKNYINKWKCIFFTFIGFGGGLGRPTIIGPAAFTAVDFVAFVEFALLSTRWGRPPDCSGISTSCCRTYLFMFLIKQFET